MQPTNQPHSMNITKAEKNRISASIERSAILGGNCKVSSPAAGVGALTLALFRAGFSLDMVSGDLLIGDKGRRVLPFHRFDEANNDEEPVDNCQIVFIWELLDPGRYEIITYITH